MGQFTRTKVLAAAAATAMVLSACQGLVVDNDTIQTRNEGFSTERIRNATYNPNYSDGVGAMRTNCGFSHFEYDDPIVAPGKPMGSHLHAFFGNTGIDAHSTAQSIADTGNSTCTGGTANRTGYWIPALIDTGGASWHDCHAAGVLQNGSTPCKALVPGGDQNHAVDCTQPANAWTRFCIDESNAMQVYYKSGYNGVASEDVQNWPAGLRMIAGDASSTTPQPTNRSWWGCKPDNQGQQVPAFASIAETNCQPGQLLVLGVEFPQCWDGRNLDSPDHKSHMAYGQWGPISGQNGAGCPDSHPVPLTEVTTWAYWRIPAGADISNWRLASDMYDGPGGYSGHSDWFGGWDPDVYQRLLDHCFADGLDCQMNLLGDGTTLY